MSMVSHGFGRILRASTKVRGRLFPTPHQTIAIQQEKIPKKKVPIIPYGREFCSTASSAIIMGDRILTGFPRELLIPEPKVPPQRLNKSLMDKIPPTLKKFTLQEKVCVVTGGARGLGFNMAQGLAEVGAKAIVLIDINQDLGNAAAMDLHQTCGVPITFFQVDVRDEKVVTKAINGAVDMFGSVDVLINSAGIADSNIKAEEYDPALFRRLMDVNVTGSFLVAQACARHMIPAANGGSILFIASMSGSIVNYPQEQCCYNASKAAVIQLGKSLAAEWARHKIRVNCISPGYMDTALNRVPALDAQKKIWTSRTPQDRLGQVDELNGLAVYLASDASLFVTGANYVIDGGYSVY